jgi:hypothetical protein
VKKNFKYYAAAWAILLLLFNIICFATPSELYGMNKYGGAFWSGYALITLAFIGQLICAWIAFSARSREKFFLNAPLITISYSALILSFIIGGLCMAIPNVPNWIGIILCAVILAFAAISVIKASTAAELISASEEKVQSKTAFIRAITADAENLINRAGTPETKAQCKKVYDALRYSDPMSSAELTDIEAEIERKFAKFSAKINAGDDCGKLADEIAQLAAERNAKCKMGK